jgi:hypothetical protein
MKKKKPATRTEASKPRETRHLTGAQKTVLDIQAEAEHAGGRAREKLTRQMSAKS